MATEKRDYANSIELRSEEGEDTTLRVAGLAAPFGKYSHDFGDWKEVIAEGAFDETLKRVEDGEAKVYFYWSHNSSMPLCSTRSGKLKLTKTEEGLEFEADGSSLTPMMRAALEDGDLGVSIGFYLKSDSWERVEGDDTVDYIRTLHEVELDEISLVTRAAYPDTSAAKRSLEAFKEEFREEDNKDTQEQLRRVLHLQASLRVR